MSETRLRLGETLVEAGVIAPETLKRALELQKERQLRLGTILLQEGFVTESQLVQALSLKLSIPWVSLWRIDIPDALLDMVPVNVAEEFFLIPIYIRTTKGGERALYVAMNDPTDENALRFVTASSGMPVKPMIAGPSDLAAAIRLYYYGEEDAVPSVAPAAAPVIPPTGASPGEAPAAPPPPPPAPKGRASIPMPPPPSAAAPEPGPEPAEEDIEEIDDTELEDEPEEPVEAASGEQPAQPDEPGETAAAAPAEAPAAPVAPAEPETPAPPAPPEAKGEPGAAPAAEAGRGERDKVFADKAAAQREAERRLFGVGRARATKGFALTLLDGTQISFGPAVGRKKASSLDPGARLTQEDLLAGLRAAARGEAIEGFLPSDHWQAYTGALLGVLMRKHLVFFEEFMTELEAITGKPKK